MNVETRFNRKFGDFTVVGSDRNFFNRSIKARVRRLGLSHACPDPNEVMKKYGVDWTEKRYASCNYWMGWIVEQAGKLNPSLAVKLQETHRRPENEPVGKYNPWSVPESHKTEVSLMSTPWGYALSRVLIEWFERDNYESYWTRVKTGLKILKDVIQISATPAELLVRLANEVVKAGVSPEAVLKHVFSTALEEEGVMFLVKEVLKEMGTHTPELYRQYISIGKKYTNYKQGMLATIGDNFTKKEIIIPNHIR